MSSYKSLCNLIRRYGFLLVINGLYASFWVLMGPLKSLCVFKDSNGSLCVLIGSDAFLWILMGHYGS